MLVVVVDVADKTEHSDVFMNGQDDLCKDNLVLFLHIDISVRYLILWHIVRCLWGTL